MKSKPAFILLAISTFLLKVEVSDIAIPLISYERIEITRLNFSHALSNWQTIIQILMIISHFALFLLPLLVQKKHSKIKLVSIPLLFLGSFIYLAGIMNFAFIICLVLWIFACLRYVRDEREIYDHRDIEF